MDKILLTTWYIQNPSKILGETSNLNSRTFVSCSSETGDIASGVAGHESTKVPTKEGEGAKNRENAKKQTERRDPDEHQPVHGDATTNQT